MIPTEQGHFECVGSIWPPRFKTIEDARLYEQCLKDKTTFPIEKWVWPCKVVGGLAVVSQEYKDAPYEMRFLKKG